MSAGLTDGLAKAPPVVERQQSSTEASSRTPLRHAAFIARPYLHLFLCDLLDVKLKHRQPGKLGGQQRVGDA
ncbi:hypothetical protein AWB82_07237 [Caballeronia glebae]|uniref:Uncharacterized protein n=1 Tax=Caballeronia glebae TaxID=1777143 RepID=A0A158DVV2_9BURK|nr:hypothetical protein AWB82_07237 [Caballeronia glebae]